MIPLSRVCSPTFFAAGTVVDAHTSKPIVDAELRIEQPTMTELRCLARTQSDGEGRFWLSAIDASAAGVRWVVEAPAHSTLTTALPTPGSMEVGLISRRRTLLELLFKWTQGMGPPWSTSGAPTPNAPGVAKSVTGPSRSKTPPTAFTLPTPRRNKRSLRPPRLWTDRAPTDVDAVDPAINSRPPR